MSKHKHHKRSAQKAGIDTQQQPQMQTIKTQVDMTPGRAPTEGGDIDAPSHERWEQDTFDRDPVEG